MSYRIIADSCCEFPEGFREEVDTVSIPLSIIIEDHQIVDDETFDQADFLKRFAESETGAKSSCPSPDAYLSAMKCDADRVYVITLSGNLSGSYNSAVIAKDMYQEEFGDKQIYVFDSRSASCGETQIAFWIRECEEKGMSFEEITTLLEEKIDQRRTLFTLESLEALRKAGRLSQVKSIIANTLNIKPILAGSLQGTIYQVGKARGINRALSKMVELAVQDLTDLAERHLMITHCNCPERAESVKQEFLAKAKFKNVTIMDTRGISSLYASDGGIIITL